MSDEAAIDAEEARLVAASRAGDQDAFADLVHRHKARVFRLAGRFFLRREDVEDVAQDTFITAWRRLSTYAAKAPFEHWITRICLRLCYARLSSERRREIAAPAEPSHATPSPIAAIDLERLLAKLSPADRFVLLLLDGEGWSVQEIADRIGWTATNVKVRAFRSRRRLRKILEERS
ncbi:MAG TPA: RNA polymerase sigma factor [Candidatus Polarisedimenticolaceae bacterium]|nr:RNA polymerase sigma factor [Candidatus Polarisedimenticolaceae bacterium]